MSAICCAIGDAPEPQTPQPPATDVDYYRPVLDHVWKTFGDDRLIYGSDWPPGCSGASCELQNSMVCKQAGPTITQVGDWPIFRSGFE